MKVGCYVAKSSHLVLLGLISRNIHSMSSGCLCSFSSSHGISSLMFKRTSSSFLFLSDLIKDLE